MSLNEQDNKNQKKLVLVVDDILINRQIAKIGLIRLGFNVIEAANGAEAVKIASKTKFDLIIMDIQMPIMNGLDATRIIRNIDNLNSDTMIIACTADVVSIGDDNFEKHGLNYYLPKPVNWINFANCVVPH